MKPLTWQELHDRCGYQEPDRVNGNTNSQATLRLFGQPEGAVRVTLYRDNHAWCPYCQKVWLWLEEKRIPYRVRKVTMFCYGQKETWYKAKVPSGMLPALELDGVLITESDDILLALERQFGVLHRSLTDPEVVTLRRLERSLFRAWCQWLCYPQQDEYHQQLFVQVLEQVEQALRHTPSPYFLDDFSVVDIVFLPFLERMHASLFYYKGFALRTVYPHLSRWFAALETRSTYLGTQSDFHTHVHDLPPQLGGCYSNNYPQTKVNQQLVDRGDWFQLPDAQYPIPPTAKGEAVYRVWKHHHNIIKVNPAPPEDFDYALRCALTNLLNHSLDCVPPPGTEVGLRYLRDRINVPRDMSIYSAKYLRQALEQTAQLLSDRQPDPLPTRHRRDQDPANFTNKPLH
ncbi:MAG: glutathione S-transferase family protein [Pseudanabaenaceae cyanobacterium SKYGB_i_bin29]|nr:glutathione S-transferase family protein [Pseudanabaenaceae cyanobacterium SKYG29]MDW8421999.1 glutathione S-transferase family protein [Pseudanabaenaceae cyanobacterium SKYGB_i_bin29]